MFLFHFIARVMLAVEMFKVFKDVSPRFIIKIFLFKDSDPCDLRHLSQFETILKLNILNDNLRNVLVQKSGS